MTDHRLLPSSLVFLHGTRGLPSPISVGNELDTVTRLTGVHSADIGGELQEMRGSITLLIEQEEGSRWVYRHPIVADAYATLVAESAELVEIYLQGAKPDRLLSDVFCGLPSGDEREKKLRVPRSLYPIVLQRVLPLPIDASMQYFLAERCDEEFLRMLIASAQGCSKPLLKSTSRWLTAAISVF